MHSCLRVDYTEIKAMPLRRPTKGTVAILYCLRDIFVPERHRLAIPNTAYNPMFEVYWRVSYPWAEFKAVLRL